MSEGGGGEGEVKMKLQDEVELSELDRIEQESVMEATTVEANRQQLEDDAEHARVESGIVRCPECGTSVDEEPDVCPAHGFSRTDILAEDLAREAASMVTQEDLDEARGVTECPDCRRDRDTHMAEGGCACAGYERDEDTFDDADRSPGMRDQDAEANQVEWYHIDNLFQDDAPQWMIEMQAKRPGGLYRKLVPAVDKHGVVIERDNRPGWISHPTLPGADKIQMRFVGRVNLIVSSEKYNCAAEWDDLTDDEQFEKKREPRIVVYEKRVQDQHTMKVASSLGILLAKYAGESDPSDTWGANACLGDDGLPFTFAQFDFEQVTGSKYGVQFDDESSWLQTVRQYHQQFRTPDTLEDAEARANARFAAKADHTVI